MPDTHSTHSSNTMEEKKIPSNLGYLEIPQEVGSWGGDWMRQEGFRDKFLRKTSENPLVPVGLAVTVGALSYGLYQMKTGDKVMSQRMMRLRVAAQAFTVVALLGGVIYQGQKSSRRGSGGE